MKTYQRVRTKTIDLGEVYFITHYTLFIPKRYNYGRLPYPLTDKGAFFRTLGYGCNFVKVPCWFDNRYRVVSICKIIATR